MTSADKEVEGRPTVVLVHNHMGEDEYEKLKDVDPSTLGFEPEYPIDVATVREEYEALVRGLCEAGFEARTLALEDDVERLHELLRTDPPDVVFNLVESFQGRSELEAAVAALYEVYGVAYTGATPFALTLCQRKGLAKQLLRENGVRTPRYKQLPKPRVPRRHGLHYPLIVKPAREDASSGVDKESVVYDLEALSRQVDAIFEDFGPPVLVEEYIDGRELHVSVIGNDPPAVLPFVEYDFSALPADHPNVISWDIKWNPLQEAFHRVHEVCPAALPREIERRVRRAALDAFRITNCRDYARVDLRLTPDRRVYVLEVNPNPDLTEGVSFMRSAEEAGMSFSQALRRIVECALARRGKP